MPLDNDILDAPGQPPPTSPDPQPPVAPPQPAAAAPPPAAAGASGAAAQPPAPPKEFTPEEGKGLNELLGEFLEPTPGEKAKAEKEAAAAAAASGEPGAQSGSPAPAGTPPAKPKTPKKKPAMTPPSAAAPPAPALTATDIATATAEAVARVMKPAAPPQPEGPKLDEDDEYTFKVYEHLETIDPKRKGTAERFKAAQLKAYAYQDKWETENPGQEFDPDAEEHAAWRAANEYDSFPPDREFRKAEVDMEVQQRLEKERERLEARLSPFERAQKLQAAQPVINQQVVASRQTFWKGLGDGFQDIVSDAGVPDKAKIDAALAADKEAAKATYTAAPALSEAILSGEFAPPPLPTAHRLAAARALDAEVPEIYALMEELKPVAKHPGAYDPASALPDPQFPGLNPLQAWQRKVGLFNTQQEIIRFGLQMQQDILAQPANEQLDAQGRPFISDDRYWKLPKPARARYWTLTPDLVIAYRTNYCREKAQENIAADQARVAAFAKAKGVTLPQRAASQRPVAPAANAQGTPAANGNKPHSPSISTPSKVAASRQANLPVATDPLSAFVGSDF
jgi:hypothetical protein